MSILQTHTNVSDDDTVVSGPSFVDVLQRRRTAAIVTFVIVFIVAMTFILVHKTKYVALSHVVLVSDPSGRDPTLAGVDMPTIATGSTVLLDVRQKLGLTDSVNDLRRNVSARIAPRSSLMTIAVQSQDPRMAISLNNAITDSFVHQYSNLGGLHFNEVTRRLSGDVRAARAQRDRLERLLEENSAGAAYVGSQASLDASAAHLGELEQIRGVTVGQFVTDRADLEADLVLPGKSAKEVRYEILRNNAAYHETEALVAKDLAAYTTTRAGVRATYPGIAGFSDKISQEGHALAVFRANALAGRDAYSPSQAGQVVQTAKAEAAVRGDRAKLQALDDQIQSLKIELRGSGRSKPSLGALRSERDTAEAQLQALSLALSNSEASNAQASALGEVVIVDRATEARSALVGLGILIILGLLCALIVGIGTAYLFELMVPRLFGPKDIERVYGRPSFVTLRTR